MQPFGGDQLFYRGHLVFETEGTRLPDCLWHSAGERAQAISCESSVCEFTRMYLFQPPLGGKLDKLDKPMDIRKSLSCGRLQR